MQLERMRKGFIIFDGDDTLWDVESLYQAARRAIKRFLSDEGIDPERWEGLQRAIDVDRFVTQRFSPDRFPGSCVDAYLRLAQASAISTRDELITQVDETARSVFSNRAPLVPDAETTLERLREDFDLLLLTQGDESIQQKRIADSGLKRLFAAALITPHKDERAFRAAIDQAGANAHVGWSVGNSLASDIEPALHCGLRVILVHSESWEFENRESNVPGQDVIQARSLVEIPRILLDAKAQIA